MFTLSELWSVTERQGHYKFLKPWWEVFMDYLVLLMLMVSILAGTLLLSRDTVVCIPIHPTSDNHTNPTPVGTSLAWKHSHVAYPVNSPAKGVQNHLDYQQYIYVGHLCYEALPWFSRFLPYVTLLQSLLLLASGSFWFHFPQTSARIEHFLAILAKCCESPWTSRALSHAARLDRARSHPIEEGVDLELAKIPVPHFPKHLTRQSSLDSGTDSPLLLRKGSTSTVQPSPCPSKSSRCSTLSSSSIQETPPISKTAPIIPEDPKPRQTLDRRDGEQARALFERVRKFRSHCETSNIIYKVYSAQTLFKVLKVVVIVGYTTPLLSSITFNHICQPDSVALTGYQTFHCSHALSTVLRKLMKAYVCLMGLYSLLGFYTLFWTFYKSLRQYSFRHLQESGSMLDAPDLRNDLAFLLHMTDQYDPLLAQRLSVFLSPVSETRLIEENLERRWNAAQLRSMIASDHQGRSSLQLVAVPHLPPALFTLNQLQVLKLELIGNAKLTAQISNMAALRELHLYHCSASVESGALVVLQERLEALYLTFTQATEIPGWVYSLRNLQELHLSGRLASESTVGRGWALGSLRQLRLLRVLSLHGLVQRIPSELSEVASSLVRLEVHNEDNRLLVLTGLKRLGGLAELELQGCQLERLPSALLTLPGLRSLDLQFNNLRTLEELLGLQHLRHLSGLRLAHNHIVAVPTTMGVLRSLELLDLSHNELRSLPPAFFMLHRLRRLLLAGNLLEELPVEVGALSYLNELDLSGNRLESLPKEIFDNCKKLCILNVSNNSLGSLHMGVGSLRHLCKLNVQGNNLENLPTELGCCSGLRGGGLLVERWLLQTLPRHVRDVLQQPSCSSSEANSRPGSDYFPTFSATQWSFYSAMESRI